MESERIDDEMFQRHELIKKLEIEMEQVSKVPSFIILHAQKVFRCDLICHFSCQEKDKAENINMETKNKLENFKVPDVGIIHNSIMINF